MWSDSLSPSIITNNQKHNFISVNLQYIDTDTGIMIHFVK